MKDKKERIERSVKKKTRTEWILYCYNYYRCYIIMIYYNVRFHIEKEKIN